MVRLPRALSGRARPLASGLTVSIASASLVAAAFLYPGAEVTDVDLNDRSVWVTNSSQLLVGRLNHDIGELTAGLRSTAPDVDVQQAAGSVVVLDSGASTVSVLDPALVALLQPVPVPAGSRAAVGGTMVAISDPATGDVWVRDLVSLGALDVTSEPPDLQLDQGGWAVAGSDGAVHGLSLVREEVVSWVGGATSTWELERPDRGSDDLDLTSVGAQPVVLDRTASQVLRPGQEPVRIDGAEQAVLQQPGPPAAGVTVATASALVRVGLGGDGEPVVTATGGEGAPSRPVQLAGCRHGAWGDPGVYVGVCDDGEPVVRDIPAPGPQGPLVFRVNRDVVVLNDTRTGAVWLPDEELALVDNWDSVVPPEEDEDQDEGDDLGDRTEDDIERRLEENNPPVAQDDDLGVRPGRSTLLRVLDNDTDLDGDLLTVQVEDASLPDGFSLAVVQQGTVLQLDVPADATGSVAIPYVVDDGREGTDTATADVTVRTPDQNEAPVQWRRTTTVLEQSGSTVVQVLPDWSDPDGDDLVLQAAAATTADTVRFAPSGEVTFVDSGTATGRKEVSVVVGDGIASTEGTTVLDVRPSEGLAPVAEADHLVLQPGEPGTVRPLLNDHDPTGEGLRLASVSEAAGLTTEVDHTTGTVGVTAAAAGTTYLEYLVTNGPQSASGLIRVDVREAPTTNSAPVAVRDVALLRAGRHVLVDPLANDEDADDDVLVVQSVGGADDAGLSVAVLDHQILRITAVRELTGPVPISYLVSDGTGVDEGQVLVVPVPAGAQLQPPVAVPDEATVRVGDVVTVDVLANDSHPDGDALTIAPDLLEGGGEGDGLIFVSGDVLRFQAPEVAGTYYAVYSVVDSRGQSASTQVTFHVLPLDPENNQAPVAPDVVARALAGTQTRVVLPLDGADPDGDSVHLVGLGTAPNLGRVVELGRSHFVYEASPGAAGTDVLTYVVSDAWGARSTGRVRIGVAAPALVNNRPVVVDDVVTVRPGRRVQVPVLVNDSDPDGDEIGFAEPALTAPEGVVAAVRGDRVEVQSPGQDADVTVGYTVHDGRGGTGSGYLTVLSRAAAPLLPPVARDDVLTQDEVEGRTTVEVPVLDNDEDPDGTRDGLVLAVSPAAAQAARIDGDLLVVDVREEPQVLAYSVTDEDGLVGWAFVLVPGTAEAVPYRPSDAPALEVVTGQELTIDLTEQVTVRQGRSPRVTAEDRVSATSSDGSALVVDQTTLRFVSAAGFVGPASVSVEVTDGTGPDDPEGHVASITLPITVLPDGNQPPVLTAGQVQVAPGEPATTIDLESVVADPDPADAGRHELEVGSSLPSGISASLSGSVLAVSAEVSVPRGTVVPLTISATDPAGARAEGVLTVQVVASTRGLAKATDDLVTDGAQGRTTTVDVLANDTNPFPGTPLSVVSTSLETGDAQLQASGSRVSVTPGGDFVGSVVVAYTVADATGDPDRYVEGRLEVVVRGRPDVPAAPTVLEVRDRTVVLQWVAPAGNGSAVIDYDVTADGFSRTCASTTCTLDGLVNDREYRFSVSARNEIGRSDPSPPSAVARPDTRPDRPAAPTLVFGDGSLQVSWTAPASAGSTIQSYTLEISPAGDGPTSVTVPGTSYTWSGLTNGASYQVRVQAKNRAPEPSDFSEYSRPEVPAGVPATPFAPTAEPAGAELGGQVSVRWEAPDGNGAVIERYDLQVFRGGSLMQTLPVAGDLTQQTIEAENSQQYTFRVAALNKAGSSVPSPASVVVVPYGQPGQITSVNEVPMDRAVLLEFAAPPDNGRPIQRYEYRTHQNVAAIVLPADRVVRGLTNGSQYDMSVRACNDFCGGWSSQFEGFVIPFGPVNTPGASAQGNSTSVTLRWSAPTTNGRGLDRLELSIDGGGWERVAVGNGERVVGNGHAQTHSIRVRAFDTEGQVSADAAASARSADPPRPAATLIRDRSAVGAGGVCTHSSCRYLDFTVSNFPAGTYQVCAHENGSSFYCVTRSVPSNGRVDTPMYYGIPGGRVRIEIVGVMFTNEVTW